MVMSLENELDGLCEYCDGGTVTTYASGDKYESPEQEPCDEEIHKLKPAILNLINDTRIDEVKRMKAFVLSTPTFDENETSHDRRLEFLIKRLAQLKKGQTDGKQS